MSGSFQSFVFGTLGRQVLCVMFFSIDCIWMPRFNQSYLGFFASRCLMYCAFQSVVFGTQGREVLCVMFFSINRICMPGSINRFWDLWSAGALWFVLFNLSCVGPMPAGSLSKMPLYPRGVFPRLSIRSHMPRSIETLVVGFQELWEHRSNTSQLEAILAGAVIISSTPRFRSNGF